MSNTNSNQPTTLISKIKSSILILLIANLSPYLLSLFYYPIYLKHYIFLNFISLASIIYIFSISQHPNKIQQVFEAKNIHINDQYPILLKGDEINE